MVKSEAWMFDFVVVVGFDLDVPPLPLQDVERCAASDWSERKERANDDSNINYSNNSSNINIINNNINNFFLACTDNGCLFSRRWHVIRFEIVFRFCHVYSYLTCHCVFFFWRKTKHGSMACLGEFSFFYFYFILCIFIQYCDILILSLSLSLSLFSLSLSLRLSLSII